jgi:peptide/nickel transport system permease protein
MTIAPPVEIPIDTRSVRRNLLRETLKDPLGLASAIILILVVLAAILAPILSPQSPNMSDLSEVFAPVSPQHPLGGDSAGRDVLSRLLYGAQLSLGSAMLAVIVAMAIGVPAGLIAGYYAGAFDVASNWVSNLLIALPGIVVLLALRTATGSSTWVSMAIFGVLLAPSFYVLVRSSVSSVRNELYVDAARVSGLSDWRIIGRHILGAVRAPIVIQAAMILAIALFIQAGLEFLGFGDPSQPSWGGMLNEGFANIFRGPLLLLWPGLALGITCAALALLANALRDALEGGTPTARRRARRRSSRPAAPRASDVSPLAANALLEVRGLRVGYPDAAGEIKEVVHGVDIVVEPGQVVGLVGESGSGKTQTGLSVLGLLPEGGQITGGAVFFRGRRQSTRSTRRLLGRSIAYIPQEPITNLDPAYTVGDHLTEPLRRVGGLSKAQARARALELLSNVGIADPRRVFDSYPHQISGGMAQRVLIAGAISCDPDLIVADEPTTALDVTVQAEILDLLRALQNERKMAVVLITHNFGVVADLCERVYVLKQGQVVEHADITGLYSDPQHPYTQNLIDNILEGGPARRQLDAVQKMEAQS